MKPNPVLSQLQQGKPQIGSWLSLASPIAARFMARCGWDWLTLDMEHSSVDWDTAATIFGHIADAGCVPLIRVPSISHENAKRALDLGAHGIVFPMCNSVEQAELAVRSCKYPPHGTRSVGGNLHSLNFQCSAADYYANANSQIAVIVQAEHIDAVERCDEILRTPGIDAVFVGPNDLLASMGKRPQMETDDPQFVDALHRIRTTALKHGVAPGIHVADAEAAQRRIREGWQFIAISSELGFMNAAATSTIESIKPKEATGFAKY